MACDVRKCKPILLLIVKLTLVNLAIATKEEKVVAQSKFPSEFSFAIEHHIPRRLAKFDDPKSYAFDASSGSASRHVRSSASSTGATPSQASGTALRPSRCLGECVKYGTCYEELGRCDCPPGRVGADCSSLLPEPELTRLCTANGHTNITCAAQLEPALCLNACNFRGRCVGGVCVCHPGFFGADCALSLAAEQPADRRGSKASGLRMELLAGQNYTARPSGPRIYVYELPPDMNTYQNLDRLDRPLMYLLWQRLLSAGLRVADAASADFFFVPVRVRLAYDSDRVVKTVSYIRTMWPYWNASHGGSRHIFVHTGDWGRDELSEDAQLLTRNATWLTHWGLARDHEFAGWKQAHRPGRDIVLPLMLAPTVLSTYRLPHNSPLHPAGTRMPRVTTLFFAGRICGSRAQPTTNGTYPNCPNVLGREDAYSAATRQRAFFHHHGRPNWKMVSTSRTPALDMMTAKFCLAPSGGGQGKRSVLAPLLGCVPVTVTDGLIQPFEPELSWERFAVGVRERDLPVMHELLERLRPEQVAGFQAALPCAAQHLFWSSLYGSVFGEDGAYDAFETLTQVLRMRAMYPNVAPEEYEFVDSAFAAFMECREPPPSALRQMTAAVMAAKSGMQRALAGSGVLRRPPPHRRQAANASSGTTGLSTLMSSAASGPVVRQALCSHSALPTPGAPSCSRCVRRRGRLLNPGGTICCNTRELAKCLRLWD
ncbi:hypothetical protein Vretimale_12247 [Volvox reticuliferus]|uniref:EGF-like domain-containing protein n=1 Tax=Volvox reticuliferus TaxID=1737510 RepID=A0A8J4LSX1_9CHLO|nr:hypothetical protein Vretifemale_8962 [Volvox reticuliferus]GIM08267.1 hypothetical protein Vretimale_12247 [Volvox reticuliferus]